MLYGFNYALWVHNSFALAGYCQNKCQPSREKAHLKDTNEAITEKEIRYSCTASYFLSPGGFFFSPNSNHSPVAHSNSSFAGWGCGKQRGLSTLKNSAVSHV